MISDTFFYDAFNNLSRNEMEEYYKTVFMNMEGPAAEAIRVKYYKNFSDIWVKM